MEVLMKTSIRNHLSGKIVKIIKGTAASEIEVENAAGIISSVITTRSLEDLALKVGDLVHASIKSTEVGIEKP